VRTAKRAFVPPMSPIRTGKGSKASGLEHFIYVAFPALRGSALTAPGENEICRRNVKSHRNIIDHREPHQRLDVNIMRHRRQRIDKENEGVNVAFCNQRPDLLVAAKRTALDLMNAKRGVCSFDHATSRSGLCDVARS